MAILFGSGGILVRAYDLLIKPCERRIRIEIQQDGRVGSGSVKTTYTLDRAYVGRVDDRIGTDLLGTRGGEAQSSS